MYPYDGSPVGASAAKPAAASSPARTSWVGKPEQRITSTSDGTTRPGTGPSGAGAAGPVSESAPATSAGWSRPSPRIGTAMPATLGVCAVERNEVSSEAQGPGAVGPGPDTEPRDGFGGAGSPRWNPASGRFRRRLRGS